MLGWIFVVLLVEAMVCATLVAATEKAEFFIPMLISIVGIFVVLVAASKPIAMDVYRNKTTLEITYRDGVPIDSTVVYKRN